MRRILFALSGGLLWWLLVLGAAVAQNLAPAISSNPPAISLSEASGPLSLDGRSRCWIDPGGLKTAEEVESAQETLPWMLRRTGQSANLDGKTLWCRFDAVTKGDVRWFLELGAPGIDRAQFYYRSGAGRWIVQEAGNGKAVSQWPLPGRLPTFELAPAMPEPVRYWVRVEHERVDFAAPMLLYERSALLAARERQQFLLGGFFGLAALIALVAAANALAYRDGIFGAYAVYVVMLAAGQLAYLGVGAQYLWDHWLQWNETAAFVLPGISWAAGLWFAKTVTEPARLSRALDLAVWSLIAALLSAVALDGLLASRDSYALMLVFTLVGMAVVVGLLVLVRTQGEDPHIGLVALGFAPVLVMGVFPVAAGLNLIPVGNLTQYGMALGAALAMPVLFHALSLRGSRRREAQVRAAALSRTDALTGLAHLRTMLHRLEGAISRARILKHTCALMAARVSNLEAIGAEFGKEAADRVLVVTASLLRRAITDIDMAARVGDHHFALLLEGPTTIEKAMSRAQQVVASGLRSSDALPPGTVLKFHVAVALLPDARMDASATLKWLLEGVDAMPSDTRKLIRPLNF